MDASPPYKDWVSTYWPVVIPVIGAIKTYFKNEGRIATLEMQMAETRTTQKEFRDEVLRRFDHVDGRIDKK